MSLLSFLVESIDLDIHLSVQDGKLKVNAAKGVLTEDIKVKLQKNKGGIITLFEDLNISSNRNISPLSFAQQRLWVIDQMVGDSLQYHIPMTMAFKGCLNIAALEYAFNQIVKRHESLRTVFVKDGTNVLQVAQDYQPIALPIIDIQEVADKEAELDRLISEEMQKPFDLSQDLMVRLFVVQEQAERFVLLGSVHHINIDGWSMNILIQELETYYSAYINNQEDSLPLLELQYADYARWQRNYLKGDVLDSHLNYWKDRLAAAPKLHALPIDNVRPQQLSNKGKTLRQNMSLDIRHGLEALAKDHNATIFMVLHAAFSYFLSRYSGEDDIVIGTPIANREKAQLASIIGFFVNTLPLRSTFAGEQSFDELIETSKQTILNAYTHQQLPFEKIIDELQIERSISYAPLCQVMLSFQDWGRGNRDDAEIDFPDVILEHIEHHSEFSQFELTLTAMPVESGFVMEWEFSTELFEIDTVSKMMASFEILLQSFIQDSSAPVNSLPMLSLSQLDPSIKRVLGLTQDQQDIVFDNDLCIHEAFENQVSKHPNKTALVFEQHRLTYDELNQQANMLAQFLNQHEVGPESLVGVYLDRSHLMVVTILGILKSGAAYVPLDISFPIERIKMLIDETQIKLIVSQGVLTKAFTDYQNSVSTICIEALLKTSKKTFCNIKREKNGLTSKNLAYIVFTSGSTGKPKGVMVDHRSMMVRLEGWDKAFSLYEKPPCVIQMAGITVDICLGDMVKSLITGGKLVVASKETILTPEKLVALMDKEQVNFGDFVPAVLRMMTEFLLSHHQSLEALMLILVGSESWYGKDLINLKKVVSRDAKCINIYGQTESIIDVSYADVTHKEIEADTVVPIGSALAHTGLYILNNQKQFQPPGVVGELHIGGEGLACGYLNQAELTADKFISNPFTEKGRMYKTGDQVRWLTDGTLEFLGRVDHQVKIRGFRIELPEVEAEINKLANVKQAVVVAKQESLGDKRLVAYILKVDDSKVTEHDFINDVRSKLKTKLPQYMQPSAFVVLAKFPITITGKVDRRGLPEPEYNVEQDYVAPTNELEMKLSLVWQDILCTSPVGITHNFFSLGGDSILAVRLVAHAKNKGVPFSVKDLLTYQTVSELAAAIRNCDVESQSVEDKLDAFSLVDTTCKDKLLEFGYRDAYPLSYLQSKMLEESRLNGTYHDVISESMNFSWSEKAFRAAWQDMLDQYSILRTVFDFSCTPALQCVLTEYLGPIEVIDWRAKSFSQLETDISPWFKEETKQQYDFSIPLWRLTVHIYGNNEFIFTFANHHAILDGWSASLLLSEFVQRYQDYYQDKCPQLKPELLSFSSYIAAEINAVQSKESEGFWLQHLQGAELPCWAGEEASDIYRISNNFSDLTAQLESTASALSVSPRSILLAIHMWVIAQINGSNNITSSVNRHGRLEITGGDKAIGLFLNPLPLSVNTEQPSWRHLVLEVDKLQISSWSHRHYPVGLLEQKINLNLSACLFNYVDFQVNHSKDNDGSANGNNTSSYIWECVFIHRRELGELWIRLSFENGVFDNNARKNILNYYEHALKSIVSDSNQKAEPPYVFSSVTV